MSIAATYLSLIVTMLFWGGTFIAGRSLAGSVPPAQAAFLRFAIASIALAVLTRLIDGRILLPPKKQWLSLVLLGMTGVFSYNMLFFTGLQHIEAGRASLIIALNPLAITMAATLFLGERISIRRAAGTLLSLVGALFVISNGHPASLVSGNLGTGEAAILGCVVCWTAYSIIGRSVLTALSPLAAVLYSSCIGTLLLLPFALNQTSPGNLLHHTTQEWISLLFLGLLGTAAGFSLYYQAIRTIGAARSSAFINLVPFFSILLSWLLLGESIKPSVLLSGLVLLAGVYLANSSATT